MVRRASPPNHIPAAKRNSVLRGVPTRGPGSKKARREGRTLVFIDQTGFMLQPTVRRTWAPHGRTPIHYSWDRHNRLSVTGAITVSPVRQRLGLYFSIASHNLTGDDLFAFAQQLHRHLKRPLLVIWDRFSGHRKAARLLRNLYGTRIHVEFLPAYAPELNVVDHCWGQTKYGEMANFIPADIQDLAQEVTHSLLAKHQRSDLLSAFFQHAQLPL
jgi:transposase